MRNIGKEKGVDEMQENKTRQHASILMLLARSSIYRILGILAGTTIVEFLLFRRKLQAAVMAFQLGLGNQEWSLEEIVDYSWITWSTVVGFVLVTVVLCLVGCERGSKQGYTLRRLAVSERGIFFWQAGYNVCIYLIFWSVQAVLLWCLCLLYMKQADPTLTSNQTVFLAFYRNAFLHGMLPLDDAIGWVRNGIMILGLGIAAATFPFRQRRGKFGSEIVALVLLTILWFGRMPGDFVYEIIQIIMSLSVAAECIWHVFAVEEDEKQALTPGVEQEVYHES